MAGDARSKGNVAAENGACVWTGCFEAIAVDVGKGRATGGGRGDQSGAAKTGSSDTTGVAGDRGEGGDRRTSSA